MIEPILSAQVFTQGADRHCNYPYPHHRLKKVRQSFSLAAQGFIAFRWSISSPKRLKISFERVKSPSISPLSVYRKLETAETLAAEGNSSFSPFLD